MSPYRRRLRMFGLTVEWGAGKPVNIDFDLVSAACAAVLLWLMWKLVQNV